VRTPLVRLDTPGGDAELYLKLENLQPTGAFKLRGALNALALAEHGELAAGVWTASAGNMGLGVAWGARRRGLACTVVVPDSAPAAKTDALARLGATVEPVPFAEWLEVFRTRRHGDLGGLFVHAFSDPAVIAGNGTIALELLEDLPDIDAVVIPYGGGGLCCGIGTALRALAPRCRVYTCEVDTGAPLAASLAAGTTVEVPYTSSFVDGIGSPFVLPEMLELTRRLVDGAIVVSVDAVAEAIRLLAGRAHVVAEGAGAAPVAAAMTGEAGVGKIACIVSGGNIDLAKLGAIMAGVIPG
jgi:threonine dehydratase